MSNIEIILALTAGVSLYAFLKIYKDYKKLENASKVKIHKCIYNENPKCYEEPCGYCNVRKECDFCCGGNCDKCPGHRVEYIEKGAK